MGIEDLAAPLNWASIFASILGLLLMRISVFFYPQHAHKTAVRLHSAQGLLDFTRHAQILTVYLGKKNLCSFLVFQGFFGYHLYVFFNACIAMHLHLVLLRKRRNQGIWFLWVVPFIGAMFNEAMSTEGSSTPEKDVGCYGTDGMAKHNGARIIVAEGTLVISLVYMVCISILVLLQKDTEENTNDFDTATINMGDIRKARLKLAAKRLALYPLICFITMAGHVPISFNVEISEVANQTLKCWFLVGISLPGLLNSLVLVFDPAVFRTLTKCAENVGTPDLPVADGRFIPSFAARTRLSQEHNAPIGPPFLPSRTSIAFGMHRNRSCDTLVA
ncbi:hypothetical protein DSO57_1039705 [Entomophthora muscae]|uniref:Uncharacterized protein n=3 Tax=Entomophthora muscae TaxID=34485 RepID=A0ACC2RY23_9FUNG|nr:hypothetical protein DSO57_1039705 [Entomophthora muscae]